jgi:hypothetical protein
VERKRSEGVRHETGSVQYGLERVFGGKRRIFNGAVSNRREKKVSMEGRVRGSAKGRW